MAPPPPSPIKRVDLRQLYRALLRARARLPSPPPPLETLGAYRTALYAAGRPLLLFCGACRFAFDGLCTFLCTFFSCYGSMLDRPAADLLLPLCCLSNAGSPCFGFSPARGLRGLPTWPVTGVRPTRALLAVATMTASTSWAR